MFAFWVMIKNKIFGILEPIFSERKETIFEPVMLLTAYLYHRYLEAVMLESEVKIVSTKKWNEKLLFPSTHPLKS